MEIPGFTLLLQDFCEYCPDFIPEVEQNEHCRIGESPKCQNVIRCENRKRCARIAEHMQKRVITNGEQ